MNVEPLHIPVAGGSLTGVRFGTGVPTLLLHALGFSHRFFLPMVDELGAAGDCVAIDLRSHGESVALAENGTLDSFVEDVIAILDHLEWERPRIAGISLGAAVALRTTLRYPDRVGALLLDLPGFGPRSAMRPSKAMGVAAALAEGDVELALERVAEGLGRGPAQALTQGLRDSWEETPGLPQRLSRVFSGLSAWEVSADWPEALTQVGVPTSILGLKGDPGHPYEVAQTLSDCIPRAQLSQRVATAQPAPVARQWAITLATLAWEMKARR